METSTKPDPDHITYQRLNSSQVQIVTARINSDRSLNLAQIAREMGICRMTLHNIVTGAKRTRSCRIKALAERLSLDPGLFFS